MFCLLLHSATNVVFEFVCVLSESAWHPPSVSRHYQNLRLSKSSLPMCKCPWCSVACCIRQRVLGVRVLWLCKCSWCSVCCCIRQQMLYLSLFVSFPNLPGIPRAFHGTIKTCGYQNQACQCVNVRGVLLLAAFGNMCWMSVFFDCANVRDVLFVAAFGNKCCLWLFLVNYQNLPGIPRAFHGTIRTCGYQNQASQCVNVRGVL